MSRPAGDAADYQLKTNYKNSCNLSSASMRRGRQHLDWKKNIEECSLLSALSGALYQYNNNINVTRLIRSLRFSILDGRHLDQIVKGTLEAILSVR